MVVDQLAVYLERYINSHTTNNGFAMKHDKGRSCDPMFGRSRAISTTGFNIEVEEIFHR